MAGNQVTLTFAGDSKALEKALANVGAASQGAASQVGAASDDMVRAGRGAGALDGALGRVVGTSGSVADAFDQVGGSIDAVNDFMHRGDRLAMEHARALIDVQQASADAAQSVGDLEQAQNDLNQSFIDGKQATLDVAQAQIDVKQAALDAEKAQTDYNDAVAKHGKNSIEARQASLDLTQAQNDLNQANVDAEQATNDVTQAQTDTGQATRDMEQATIDAKSAQLDLIDAQKAAKKPTGIMEFGQDLQAFTPLIMSAVGAISLLQLANDALSLSSIKSAAATAASKVAMVASAVASGIWTAAQWLLNFALTANPIGVIIMGIAALIGVIVLIATKTTWFQDIWNAAWGGIKDAASAVGSWFTGTLWPWIKGVFDKIVNLPGTVASAFSSIATSVSAPFKAAFNAVSRAWNNTVGRLSWSVPGWVPSIGGNTISAPKLPTFHTGGRVPGAPGTEVVAKLMAGERVLPVSQAGGGGPVVIRSDGSRMSDLLVELLAVAVGERGGDVQVVLGGRSG